mmetsp:Transcript_1915/g.5297  ORF Transcript_1915/g.5297 Transcript_1915/m.5297 type:complete len:122 (+) Transcript_1915:1259-1624(+)
MTSGAQVFYVTMLTLGRTMAASRAARKHIPPSMTYTKRHPVNPLDVPECRLLHYRHPAQRMKERAENRETQCHLGVRAVLGCRCLIGFKIPFDVERHLNHVCCDLMVRNVRIQNMMHEQSR